MLQSFNDRLKGPFTWIVVISVSTVFVLTGSSFMFGGFGSKATTVAKVGDYEISTQQYQGYVEQTKSTTDDEKKELLNMLIEQRLMMSATQKENIQLSKLALQSAIFNNPAFQDENGFSQEKLQMAAKYYGGVANIENMLGQNILLGTIADNMSKTGFTTEAEKNQLAKVYSQEKAVSYFKLDPKKIATTEKVSDTDLEKYFAEHKSEYVKPASENVEYYVVSKANFIAKDKVSDADVKAYYDSNPGLFANFDDKAKESIQKILKNRAALAKYNAMVQGVDAQKFATLENELGKAKQANISNNDKTDVEGLDNARFFSGDKYDVLQTSDDSAVIYYVQSLTPEKQQTLADVKAEVEKAYKAQESKNIARDKAEAAVANITKGVKIKYPFEKITIANDTKDINKGFKQAVIDSSDKVASFTADDGMVYVYQVDKVDDAKANIKNVPLTVMNAYDKAEQKYYTEVLRNDIPVKINYKNI